MKCPHCLDSYHSDPEIIKFATDVSGEWAITFENCPTCNKVVVRLLRGRFTRPGGAWAMQQCFEERLVRPKNISRTPVPSDVPEAYASDYREACLVLADSPKASAALSRRCLQHILREKAGVKKSDLAKEIQEVLDSGRLPTHLMESLDSVRNVGNFAAHPIKTQSSGEIIDVEPGEAEWNLDVIEALFDFYFVQPELIKKKRADLNKKLQDAGKPPMK